MVERGVTLQGKQADKKMGVKKMKSGIQFFAVNLFASPETAPELGKLVRSTGSQMVGRRVTSRRFRQASRLASEESAGLPESAGAFLSFWSSAEIIRKVWS
jgi:hypothetical protein